MLRPSNKSVTEKRSFPKCYKLDNIFSANISFPKPFLQFNTCNDRQYTPPQVISKANYKPYNWDPRP